MPTTNTNQPSEEILEPGYREQRLAEAVRSACIEAALDGYERARISGLCEEGALECAIDAIRMLDLGPIATSPREAPSQAGALEATNGEAATERETYTE